MNKLYSLLITFFLFAIGAFAQTTVSGFINANTNWTMAGSPYIVTGNALLSQGFTLTIDPGVVVKFGTNNALQIDGQLIAIGTPTQHIVFTSNQANPQPGDWAKLHFSDFCTDAIYNAQGNYVSGTIMKYCDVLYGGSLMWGNVDIQDCSPYFNHCNIQLGSWCGVNFNGDHLTIDSSRITDFPKRGIYFQGNSYLLRNDTMIACAEGAIHCFLGTTIQSQILNCFFRWNYGVISGGVRHLTIRNSTFVYNAGPAVISLDGGTDTISCNKFRYNATGPVLEMQSSLTSGSCVVHNNLIEYNVNSSPSSWDGASVFYIGVDGWDTVFIANNTIQHNSSPGKACCFFSSSLSGNQNTLQFYNNVCTENDGMSFFRMWGMQSNNPSFDFMYLNGNAFINPLCTYELYNSVPYGSPNLYVDGNYWGSSNTSFVDGVIYDYFDFANQSVVYYMPILTFPPITDTSCQAFQLPMGIANEFSLTNDVQISPNPASNQFIVHSESSETRNQKFVMCNSLGQEVKRVQLTQQDQSISFEEFAEGIYFYRIESESRIVAMGKIVKE